MNKFQFLEWKVYKDAQGLFLVIVEILKRLSREQRYELGSQVSWSSLSVVLNIAEGSGKTSDKEMNRYFEISLGSLYETLAAIDTLKQMKVVSESEWSIVYEKVEEIARQLGGFKKKLNK